MGNIWLPWNDRRNPDKNPIGRPGYDSSHSRRGHGWTNTNPSLLQPSIPSFASYLVRTRRQALASGHADLHPLPFGWCIECMYIMLSSFLTLHIRRYQCSLDLRCRFASPHAYILLQRAFNVHQWQSCVTRCWTPLQDSWYRRPLSCTFKSVSPVSIPDCGYLFPSRIWIALSLVQARYQQCHSPRHLELFLPIIIPFFHARLFWEGSSTSAFKF